MFRYFLVLVLAIAFATNISAQPKLSIDGLDKDNVYSWGKVKPKDNPLKGKIKIRNTGNQTLVIEKVRPSCGCTTAPLDKDNIKPGEFATLDVSFDITGYDGSVTKGISIHSNDLKDPMFRFLINAIVVRSFTFFPQNYFIFPNMKIGEESKSVIVITNASGRDLKIEDVIIENDNVRTNIRKNQIIPANGDYTLEAYVTPRFQGPFFSKIVLETNDPENPSVAIDLRGSTK